MTEPTKSFSTHLIDPVLQSMESISLDEMDGVKLLNRQDTKYIFHEKDAVIALENLGSSYRILEIDGKKAFNYESLYFDTPDRQFYHAHQNGKLNRHKVRFRRYMDSGLCFLEVKFKNNKSKTIKMRDRKKSIEELLTSSSMDFIKERVPPELHNLEPAHYVYYKRATLVNTEIGERITLDLELRFKDKNNEISLMGLAIGEVKQKKFTASSPFVSQMLQQSILPNGFSKFCIGMALLNPDLKQNNFKPKLRQINKLIHG